VRLSVATAVAAALAAYAPGAHATPPNPNNPANWSNARLAAQLVVEGVDMGHLSEARQWVKAGLGGIVLFGTPPQNLGAQLAAVRAAGKIPPFVTSDEEGGEVQRLAPVIYRLHSAQYMGHHYTPARVKVVARHYARHMHALGVDVDLAPVADLLVPGYYMAQTHRAFAKSPTTVSHYVRAWIDGMRAARVDTTVKHWPGHGHATDSHQGTSTTPPFSSLKTHDLIPFNNAIKDNVPLVMIGDLIVPGLTEQNTPASISPHALKYLRKHSNPSTVIITDSLTMGAIQAAGYSTERAAVRALKYGADLALINNGDPTSTVKRIEHALQTGYLPHSRAVSAVRRVLAAKRMTNPPAAPTGLRPADGATDVARPVTLSGFVHDRLGGTDTVHFAIRHENASTWDVVANGHVTATPGSRASYAVPANSLAPATAYEWRMRVCNAAHRCSAWTTPIGFTTAA
jgi:beta-N-acetylhexosaminidase